MMYEEFVELLGREKEVSRSQYSEIIEPVYTWHPVFESGNKQDVVKLYELGGLALFEEMKPIAEWMADMDKQINNAYRALGEAQKRYDGLKATRARFVKRYVSHKS